jgi:glycosyltransferase involved in cell wall biosynthesis
MLPETQIVGLFPELLANGGVQEAGRQTAIALTAIARARGWSTRYLALNDPLGGQVIQVQTRSVQFTGFQRGKVRFILATIRNATPNVRVIIAGHPNLGPPASLMRRFARNAKTVIVTHGVDVWTHLTPSRRRALLAADVVLAPSSYTIERLTSIHGIRRRKIQLLPWPIDPVFLKLAESPTALPIPHGFPEGPTILTVGRWVASEKYKGADDLIRAVARLRSVRTPVTLVLVGTGDDLPRLKGIAARERLGDSVRFFENLERAELAGCYARASIFALPSTGEGFGLVFLEAMAFAKPVVGVANGGTLDLIRNGVNGVLLPPRDSDALLHSLGQLLGNPLLCAKLGQAGAGIVAKEYSVEVFQQRLERIFADLVD